MQEQKRVRPSPPNGNESVYVRVLHFDGRAWKVREERNRFGDHDAGKSLIFESSSLIRRVRTYPTDWFDLADDALFRLSLGT
ncbi:MAG TPA: hypothetical protein VGM50_16960 [Gemmatimonadaceae bacterium]